MHDKSSLRFLPNGLPAEALTQEGQRFFKITLENPLSCRNFNIMQALPDQWPL
jgi:hypothetical protein